MEWQDEAIIIAAREHGETSAIVELMTRAHGRHLGLVRGARAREMRPILQTGNQVSVTWRGRLEEHLGHYRLEAKNFRAAELMGSAPVLFALQTLAAHIRLLAEREDAPRIYESLNHVLDCMDGAQKAAELTVRFELTLLQELGFGLDLSRCAATGKCDDLVYVSPRSAKAVSKEAGAPWAGRLLTLPPFLRDEAEKARAEDLCAGLDLTGFFLNRYVHGPRGLSLPAERDSLYALFKSGNRGKTENRERGANGANRESSANGENHENREDDENEDENGQENENRKREPRNE